MNEKNNLRANWSYPNAVHFGAGRISELPEICAAAGIRRPLLVTDATLIKLPPARHVRDLFAAARTACGVFAEVDANPNDGNLAAGVAAFREGGYDGVIAFGGGSGLDLGKLVAFMAGQTRPVWDFEDVGDWWRRANAETIAPIIAVPTTAGTGSEVGRAAVLLDSQREVKKIIFHPQMLPKAAICDPELTVGMPPVITAGTGMDAFVHCLEAYCAPSYHPMSRGIALEGMRIVSENLPRAFANGNDLSARAQMMSAAAMGAVAFQKGLGAAHAISHPVGALYHTHHGMTNAVVLPAVLRFNRPAIELEIAAAAAYLNIAGGFDGFYARIMELRRALGVPESLREMGVDDKRADDVAKMAIADPSAAGNPVPLTEDSARRLFLECL